MGKTMFLEPEVRRTGHNFAFSGRIFMFLGSLKPHVWQLSGGTKRSKGMQELAEIHPHQWGNGANATLINSI